MHAEPTTFGTKLALWALQVDRDRTRLQTAASQLPLASSVVQLARIPTLTPRSKTSFALRSASKPVPATQVIARDRHAEYLYACASVGATIELIRPRFVTCNAPRWLKRPKVSEKGKRAARPCRTSGTQSRPNAFRAWLEYSGAICSPGLEDVALWHERDISHSSVERVILPDASLTAFYVLKTATKMIDGMTVDADRMMENLNERSYGLVFSQPVLLALVDGGLTRDDAYRIVQRDARTAVESVVVPRDHYARR